MGSLDFNLIHVFEFLALGGPKNCSQNLARIFWVFAAIKNEGWLCLFLENDYHLRTGDPKNGRKNPVLT